jgi:hypothetical protein
MDDVEPFAASTLVNEGASFLCRCVVRTLADEP